MSKPLNNRVSSLELAANQSAAMNRNYHIFHSIVNPDGTVEKVLETIIENGVVTRDDCGRPLG